jgi:DNA mismatch endonuclease (patch repair protein)
MDRALRRHLVDGRFAAVDPVDARRLRAVRGRGNRSTDQRFVELMTAAGIEGWSLHHQDGRPADAWFSRERIAVFLDGCFWHACERCAHRPTKNGGYWREKRAINRARDLRIDEELRRRGVVVLRFFECELRELPASIVRTVAIALAERAA